MATAQKYACGFCKKSFTSERTLSAHMCPKKRRNLEKDSIASQHGLRLFQRFMKFASPTTRDRTFEDFIDSKYYTSFIKFARHLMDLRPLDVDRFVDFVFHNGIKDRDWCKDKVYEAYLVDFVMKEATDSALTRSIKTMEEWGETNGHPFNEFFMHVSSNELTHMIRMGKISPWVLYLCETFDWGSLSSEQGQMIHHIVDPSKWQAKFVRKNADCDFVREVLKEAGI